MSFPLTPFQVYITPEYLPSSSLVTFPCRSAADEYWRRVQEAVHEERELDPGESFPALRNHSQYFNISSRWDSKPQVQASKVLCIYQYSLSNLGLSPGPPSELRPDNVNGGRYYIRSVIRPNLYWYFNPDKQIIEVSSQFQTRFVIRRKTPLPFQCRPEDDIFISKDDINIFVARPDWEESGAPEVMIVKDPRKLLMAASMLSLSLSNATSGGDDEVARVVGAAVFKFKMFDGGFGVMDSRSWDGKPVYASSNTDGGEKWEFAK